MKSTKSVLIALLIAFTSSVALTGCFVDDEEVFGQIEGTNDQPAQESNDQWDD